MKKLLACLLTVALLGTSFVGCGSKNSAEEPDITDDNPINNSEEKPEGKDGKLTIWAWDPNFNVAIMNEAAKFYTEKNPGVEIEVVEMAKADVEQNLHTTLAAQTKEGLPDIVLIEDYNAQKYLQSYPGSFADLTDTINFKDFAQYKLDFMKVDNKIYGVPFDSGVTGLFYRTDILKEAGYEGADLENITWDEFIEIGKVVKEKTGKAMLSFGKTDGGPMRMMMQSAGTWYFDKDGKPALVDNEAFKESVEFYKEIMDSGIAIPTNGWDEWVKAFNNGDCATVVSGVWIVGSIKAAEDQSGKWGVAPTPRLSSVDSKNATNLGGSSWYVCEKAENRDLAIDFLKNMYAGDNEFYQTILMNNGAVGTYLPSSTGEAYIKPDEFFGGSAIYKDLSKWMTEIPGINYGSYTYEADAAIMAQMEAVYEGSMSVDDAIKAAQEQVENQIQ